MVNGESVQMKGQERKMKSNAQCEMVNFQYLLGEPV